MIILEQYLLLKYVAMDLAPLLLLRQCITATVHEHPPLRPQDTIVTALERRLQTIPSNTLVTLELHLQTHNSTSAPPLLRRPHLIERHIIHVVQTIRTNSVPMVITHHAELPLALRHLEPPD
jgi:hypothetical protein